VTEFLNKWVNPTSILAILAGIVWGVQLDSRINVLDDRTVRTKIRSVTNQQLIHNADVTDAKTVYVLDNLVSRVSDSELEIKRILLNEYGRSGPP
jgi:hypothetical protein